MTGAVIAILLLLCIGQFLYIRRIRQQEKARLDVLRSIRHGDREKIFSKSHGVMADIGYELNAIIEVRQSQIERLKKTDEANKSLLTSLSHDVRTPLASLLGYLEALSSGLSDPGEEKEYIAVAYRKATDLKAYIDRLFEWFKLNSHEQQFKFETVELNEFTREILIEWLPRLEQSHISLSAMIGDDDLLLSVDRWAYKRIVDNLIQNAVQHGNCSHLTITITGHPGTAAVQVANDGRAIPPDQLPYIFERLYKCDTARSDKGSGLGLAITKGLVTAMHGEISATSAPQQDTVFSIVFPRPK
ncbi:MAG TPA: HAMP domain-containing sensor histidine kinase [Aggregatilinea sp.]|uniref:sensor histidine kinase n=1 Tax=Aggregatilinea sp. TaxID=2806333 RepID=UPI002BF36FE3|nr:HAMP domain-containing sensor histidine kinase [Aggregatilinea sp.]HML20318.1 HAMP domain-containing sensor histidine kinase [Aggregatilinea sp.]